MVGHLQVEVAKTVLEVADVAFTAVECCHHYRHHDEPGTRESGGDGYGHGDFETLRRENERLRQLLEKNLDLLQEISASASLDNCPSDLLERILDAVASDKFLNKIESLHQKPIRAFPFDVPSGEDKEKADILINVDHENPSWWVWVSEEMVTHDVEVKSGIDNESYVVITEEHVVDGVAMFMARCILANPKAMKLTPMELQKALMKAVGGMSKVEKMLNIWEAGKMFYMLATWGLALASLYQGRAILKLAALGVHHSSKAALKIL